jgi:hypothetical protein
METARLYLVGDCGAVSRSFVYLMPKQGLYQDRERKCVTYAGHGLLSKSCSDFQKEAAGTIEERVKEYGGSISPR